jgi:hypothetical protein
MAIKIILVEMVSKLVVIAAGSSWTDDPRKGEKNVPSAEPKNPLVASNST